jgi:hypothetical protein
VNHDWRNPLVGTWQANPARSQRSPHHQFQSATIRIAVAQDVVILCHEGVSPGGVLVSGTTVFQADGREYPASAQNPDVVVAAKWVGERLLDTVGRKAGRDIGRGVYEVSPDGRTLTASISGTDASGTEFAHSIVFDRE